MNNIGQRIKELRRKNDLTQEKMVIFSVDEFKERLSEYKVFATLRYLEDFKALFE